MLRVLSTLSVFAKCLARLSETVLWPRITPCIPVFRFANASWEGVESLEHETPRPHLSSFCLLTINSFSIASSTARPARLALYSTQLIIFHLFPLGSTAHTCRSPVLQSTASPLAFVRLVHILHPPRSSLASYPHAHFSERPPCCSLLLSRPLTSTPWPVALRLHLSARPRRRTSRLRHLQASVLAPPCRSVLPGSAARFSSSSSNRLTPLPTPPKTLLQAHPM